MKEQQLQVVNQVSIIEAIKDSQVAKTIDAIGRFQAVVKSQFRENFDYGIIPGTGKKPTLLKSGAEKLVTLLGLSTTFEIMTSTRDFEDEFFDYVIKCKLSKNGELVAEGLGSANTKETKFKREEGKGAGMDNNVLKMAKKRAFVDAALQVGSLSDVFTQDFDDEDITDMTGKVAQTNSVERQLEQPITQAQAKRMFALSKGNVEIVKSVLGEYGYQRSENVQSKDYEAICKKIEAKANGN